MPKRKIIEEESEEDTSSLGELEEDEDSSSDSDDDDSLQNCTVKVPQRGVPSCTGDSVSAVQI